MGSISSHSNHARPGNSHITVNHAKPIPKILTSRPTPASNSKVLNNKLPNWVAIKCCQTSVWEELQLSTTTKIGAITANTAATPITRNNHNAALDRRGVVDVCENALTGDDVTGGGLTDTQRYPCLSIMRIASPCRRPASLSGIVSARKLPHCLISSEGAVLSFTGYS